MTGEEVINKVAKKLQPNQVRSLLTAVGSHCATVVSAAARAKKPSSNFWNSIANSVSYKVSDSEVSIGASHFAARHKHYGGVISAPGKGPGSVPAKALTIPLTPAARKKSAREFRDTFITKGGLIGRNVGKGKNKKVEWLFVLKKSVKQRPDPWYPTTEEITTAVKKAVDNWMDV
jgi:hypothetical protein